MVLGICLVFRIWSLILKGRKHKLKLGSKREETSEKFRFREKLKMNGRNPRTPSWLSPVFHDIGKKEIT